MASSHSAFPPAPVSKRTRASLSVAPITRSRSAAERSNISASARQKRSTAPAGDSANGGTTPYSAYIRLKIPASESPSPVGRRRDPVVTPGEAVRACSLAAVCGTCPFPLLPVLPNEGDPGVVASACWATTTATGFAFSGCRFSFCVVATGLTLPPDRFRARLRSVASKATIPVFFSLFSSSCCITTSIDSSCVVMSCFFSCFLSSNAPAAANCLRSRAIT